MTYHSVMNPKASATPANATNEPLGERARGLANDAGKELLERANDSGARGLGTMGKKLDEAADYVRDRGPETAGRLNVDARHVDRVAEGIHGAADYLQSRDPKSMASDLDAAIQKHPYRALMIGAAVGYTLGRIFGRD
jgi:ElaB/YqjD/DUF883 family membrane-anchored ribosome-binding protein